MDFLDDNGTDQIYISGLPRDVTEEQLAEFFGQIGLIKMDKKKRPPKPKVRAERHASCPDISQSSACSAHVRAS